MSVFAAYSRYYDLLYRDKDYAGEARYVADLMKKHAPGAKSVIEIGCGTGGHARELATLGFRVHGVDRSAGMLEAADEKLDTVEPEIRARMRFTQGDARSVRLSEKAGAVIWDRATRLVDTARHRPLNQRPHRPLLSGA